MLVKFIRAYEAYNSGETAKFDKEAAMRLIENGYALEVKATGK